MAVLTPCPLPTPWLGGLCFLEAPLARQFLLCLAVLLWNFLEPSAGGCLPSMLEES